MPAYHDPDDNLVVLFKHQAFENSEKSLAEGRPIFDEVEVCEIRAPGLKDVKVFPATDVTRWIDDPFTGRQRKQTYVERFRHQYQQFKAHAAQTKSGTPLELAAFLSDGRRAELRAQNVYTVEMLADIDGAELKNLGPGGREMKNRAIEFIAESRATAPNKQMLAELEMLRARNALLEEDLQLKKNAEPHEPAEFAGMSLDQLREFITVNTGQEPLGAKTMNRKTLIRLAENARPERVA